MLQLVMQIAIIVASASANYELDEDSAIAGRQSRAKRDVTNGELVQMLEDAGVGEYEKQSDTVCSGVDTACSGVDAQVFLMVDKKKKKDADDAIVAVKVSKGAGAKSTDSIKHEVEVLRKLDGLDGVPKLIFPDPKGKQKVGVLQSKKGTKKKLDFLIESAAGPDIATLLENDKISLEQAKHIVIKFAQIIGSIHAKGIAHKDIFPTNICVNRNDPKELVLIDFGGSVKAGDLIKDIKRPYYVNDWLVFIQFASFILHHRKFKPNVLPILKQRDMWEAVQLFSSNQMIKSNFPTAEQIKDRFISYAEGELRVSADAKAELTSW